MIINVFKNAFLIESKTQLIVFQILTDKTFDKGLNDTGLFIPL